MANEDLIYRITRAVYDRLGNAVDETTVEQLVTDIYNQVRTTNTPLRRRSRRHAVALQRKARQTGW